MAQRMLPRTVLALGLVSFFADLASDMIFPLLPVFLTTVLRAGPALLGLIEGAADMVASLLKLIAGRLSDRLPQRKPLVLFGYGVAGVVRPLVAAAAAPWHVLAIRLADRVGKGLRSAPRDALIADSADPSQVGRAFGFHRAMDHAGAVAGPLVASALLGLGLELRTVFWWAAVPSLLSILLVLIIREPPRAPPQPHLPSDPKARAPLPQPLKIYFGILLLFSLGNSSDAFLLLRAHELGVSDAAVPALWALLHVSKLVSSYLGGGLADRIPRARLILGGWVLYAGVYLGLGLAQAQWQIWGLFGLYGVYYGLTEPAEKALVRDMAPKEARGSAFGAYNAIVGVSALPAGLMTGWLWKVYGPLWALGLGALLAGIAAVLLMAWEARRPVPA